MSRSAARAAAKAASPEGDVSAVSPWHGMPLATARRFHQRCTAEVAGVVADADLTTLQHAALLYLSKQPGTRGVEQNNLAAGMDVDRNSASLLVEQLVKKGFVERRVNGDDRRVRLLSLAPKGKKVLLRLRSAYIAANERILAPLSPREREVLFELLHRLVDPPDRQKPSRRP